MPDGGKLNQLLEAVLRKDPKESQRQQVMDWMAEKAKERALVEKGGGGFVQGAAPLLLGLLGKLAPAASAIGFGQHSLDKLMEGGRTRDEAPVDVPDLGMAFPVFGVGKTGRLADFQKRITKGRMKELPTFSDTGMMAPARQRELTNRMAEWIPQTSTKQPEHLQDLLNKFIAERPGWGQVPMEKGGMTDKMHKSLRQAYFQALKEMGYGGIKYPEVREYNPRLATGTSRPLEIVQGEKRPFEEILQFEQKGNSPSNWEKTFQALLDFELSQSKNPKTLKAGK